MKGFADWFFKQKDIDKTLIALLISSAVTQFIDKFAVGFINPLIMGLINTGDGAQTVTVFGRTFEFKMQTVLIAAVNAMVVLLFVYYLATGLKAKGY